MMRFLGAIGLEDTDTLRKAFLRFVSERRSGGNYSLDDESRLYVLNRFLFNVPARSKRGDVKFFGGWIGPQDDGEDVDPLWPFAVDDAGRLELVGEFLGYSGEEYDAVEEFDYFNQRFGRRR